MHIKYILLSGLALCNTTKPYNDWQNPALITAIAGVTTLSIWGINRYHQRQQVARNDALIAEQANRFNAAAQSIVQAEELIKAIDIHTILLLDDGTCNEKMCIMTMPIAQYKSSLTNLIQEIVRKKTSLASSLPVWHQQPQYSEIAHQATELLPRLERSHATLIQLLDKVDYCYAYAELRQVLKNNYAARYSNEIKLFEERSTLAYQDFSLQLNGLICARSSTSFYPYLDYAHKVQYDFNHLDTKLQNLRQSALANTNECTSTLLAATTLHVFLKELYTAVISISAYHEELARKEHAQQHEQIAALEREKVQLERQRIEAYEKQVRETQRQNDLRERELREHAAVNSLQAHCNSLQNRHDTTKNTVGVLCVKLDHQLTNPPFNPYAVTGLTDYLNTLIKTSNAIKSVINS